jgi:hypothetical protein
MRLLQRVRPFLPWFSLLTGVVGAFLMNRTPGRAWIVVVAAVLGWAMLAVFNIVERAWTAEIKAAEITDPRAQLSTRKRSARFAILLSNQIAIQQALLFPLPFYARAAAFPFLGSDRDFQPGHVVFFLGYAAALVVVLWDPLFNVVIQRAPGAFALQAFAAFCGLNMVLPVLGLSNTTSLVVAGAATALGVPLLVLLETEGLSPQRKLLAIPAAILLVVLARVAAPLVPPAPLELVHVGIGTRVDNKELVGEAPVIDGTSELVCHSTIKAPLGLKDALFHVWRKDKKPLDAIAVVVSGGREAGFRTWSRKKSLGPTPAGRYTCSVETASGQVLGRASVVVR